MGGPANARLDPDAQQQDLNAALTMLNIRRNDSKEIEHLLRTFVLPDLPLREGRHIELSNLIGTNVIEALHVVYYLHKSLKNAGDVCEFGVAQGATSALLSQEIAQAGRKLWLFDSFEGLPKPHEKDKLIHDIFNLGSMAKYQGRMRSPAEEVLARLHALKVPQDRYELVPGWVEDSLKRDDLPERVAFAYIDFDFYNPIKETLAFLDTRMAPGSSVVVDDYGFFSAGAAAAVDEFVEANSGRYEFVRPPEWAGAFCILTKQRD